MPNLPAICLNPACGFVFPSSVEIVNSTNIVFQGCLASPCPKCGSHGQIPNGRYDSFDNFLYLILDNISDVLVLNNIVKKLKWHIALGTRPADIKSVVTTEVPQLQSIWNLIPETKAEAYTFITILIMFLTLLATCFQAFKDKHPTITNTQTIINQTYQNYYSQDNSVKFYIQQDSHNENKEPQKE